MAQNFITVADALHWAENAFDQAGLFYGHGTDNAWDDAVAIIIHVLDLPVDVSDDVLSKVLTNEQSHKIEQLFNQRIEQKIPVAYLTQQTWFCGLPFYVDQRVIIPRSPIAELIESQFEPWIQADRVYNILDLCCGSACIAIACAYAFPQASVDAIDLSSDALAVAAINVEQHKLETRVNLIQSDLFQAIKNKQYDIIVSNPPYVDASDFSNMPREYQHEPELALTSGHDGLELTRKILSQADEFLANDGIIIVEVGNSANALEQAYPDVEFTWMEFERGGDGVFLLTKQQLAQFNLSKEAI